MQLSRSLQFKEDEVARLAANVKERDIAVSVAELRAKEVAEARADAERARADRDAAAATAAAADAAQAAARTREVDLDASLNLLQRQVYMLTPFGTPHCVRCSSSTELQLCTTVHSLMLSSSQAHASSRERDMLRLCGLGSVVCTHVM